MLDLSTEQFVPLTAFLFALAGSPHCVGMCGGLVVATCNSTTDNVIYQIGRLIGYTLMAIVIALIGHQIDFIRPYLGTLGGVAFGLFFILWGVQFFRGRPIEVKLPKFLNALTQRVWKVPFLFSRQSHLRAFLVGFFSFLLPCGLLYAVLLGMISLQSPLMMGLTLFSFWLGTLPAMIFAPEILKRGLQKTLGHFSPRVLGATFFVVGVVTIGWRMYGLYQSSTGAHVH